MYTGISVGIEFYAGIKWGKFSVVVYDPGNVNGYTKSCKCTRGGSIYIDEAIT